MAIDGGRCHALLARSLPGQFVPIELVKATCFLCVVNQWPQRPIDPRLGGGLRGLGRSQSWRFNSNGGHKRFPL